MTVELEKQPHCITTLRVQLPPEKVAETWDEIAKQYVRGAKIPGYRPGKAPRSIVESKFKKDIREEVEKRLVGEGCREAIKERELRVLSLAEVDGVEIGEDKTMRFTAKLVTQPEFDTPVYKGIVVKLPPTEVSEEEVTQALDHVRQQHADFSDIEGRGVQMEDYAVIDYTGTIDGRPVSEVSPKAGKPLSGNTDFWVKITPTTFFPGFTDALIGAVVGESRDFDITVPEDFPVEELRGRTIHYSVTIKGLKEQVLPALDDEFAGKVIPEKTVAELRDLIRTDLESQKKLAAERERRDQAMNHLIASVECDLPENFVKHEARRILGELVRENQARGVADEVLQQNQGDLAAAATAGARERLKGTFILLRIAEEEKITATREDLNVRIAAMAERYQTTVEKMRKELEKNDAIDGINEEVLTAKVLDFVASNASVADA